MENRATNIPTVFVVFGVTGDLVRRKILPMLYSLFLDKKLPSMFCVVGFGRAEIDEAQFRQYVADGIAIYYPDAHDISDFLNLFLYQRGFFDDIGSYQSLAKKLGAVDDKWGVCSNKLYYLAVPPTLFDDIFHGLGNAGLNEPCGGERGWTRLLIEKPFGLDGASADALQKKLSLFFKEEQIYRIDHYLAKEMLQNIFNFRFKNNLFEQNWSKDFIEQIEIYLWETLGVEHRGAFYDSVGALRDVGQNHLLEMLAYVTMDRPMSATADSIRQSRAKVLGALEIADNAMIQEKTIRAQYVGYRTIDGVQPSSNTETFFRIRSQLLSDRWRGVPIIIESGKKMARVRKEIIVHFRHTSPCLCPTDAHYRNRLVFSFEPQESIRFEFWVKKTGWEDVLEKRSFDFLLRQSSERIQYIQEYATLLMNAIAGDQAFFLSPSEIVVGWRFADPIIRAWQKDLVILQRYKVEPNLS